MVLKSGFRCRSSQITSMLRWVSASSRRLAGLLDEAKAKGWLEFEDSITAATQFLSLVRGERPLLTVLGIAGNAVENVAGIVLARKGQADLAISVVKNSVAQIAAFLYPLLVLVSLLFSHHLSFALEPVYIGALLMSALAVWQITGDGEAYAFEGFALVAIYVVLATVTFFE